MKSHSYRPRFPFAILVSLFCCCVIANAQSGRRTTTKSTPTTVPAVSVPKEVAVKPQKPARIQILVGVDDPDAFSYVPFTYADAVVEVCVRRLSGVAEIQATGAPGKMNRAEAVNAAEKEKDRYVVWLQLGTVHTVSRQPGGDRDELYIDFLILEPVTAKVKRSGRVFRTIYKTGDIGISPPSRRGSPRYSEYVLRETAEEAADKILSAFGFKTNRWPR